METIFDLSYFAITILLGVTILRKSKGMLQYRLIGGMALLLVFGDAFHLLPRIYALWTTGMEDNAAALGFGKLITSITMTVFYVIFYHVWKERYRIKNNLFLTSSIYLLAIIRIVLCLMPQNDWLSYNAPLEWGIYRNIPFALLGLIIIVLFYVEAKKNVDKAFRFMWLAITLSFGFYIPVVLFADTLPIIGMLMLPKTCAYVWMIWMGYKGLNDKK
jgi:hypothetical protein